MGYVPPPIPANVSDQLARLSAIWSVTSALRSPTGEPRLNLDRHGMPKDYATYVWLLYKRVVVDESPERLAFQHGPRTGIPDLGQQMSWR